MLRQLRRRLKGKRREENIVQGRMNRRCNSTQQPKYLKPSTTTVLTSSWLLLQTRWRWARCFQCFLSFNSHSGSVANTIFISNLDKESKKYNWWADNCTEKYPVLTTSPYFQLLPCLSQNVFSGMTYSSLPQTLIYLSWLQGEERSTHEQYGILLFVLCD